MSGLCDSRIIVLGNHYWAKGETLSIAKNQFKKVGGKVSDITKVFWAQDPNAYINDFGQLCYKTGTCFGYVDNDSKMKRIKKS